MKQKILNHKNWVDLNKKYKIGLIAPSSKPLKIKKIRKLLKGEGHSLICPDDLISKKGGPYHSNSEEYRFKHLLSLLNSNEENLIIWSICGGYGAAKIVDYLKRIPKPQVEKTLIGYSDITVIVN